MHQWTRRRKRLSDGPRNKSGDAKAASTGIGYARRSLKTGVTSSRRRRQEPQVGIVEGDMEVGFAK